MIAHNDWAQLRAKLKYDLCELNRKTKFVSQDHLNYYALVDAAQLPESYNSVSFYKGLEFFSLFSLTKEHRIAHYGPQLIGIGDQFSSDIAARILRTMKYGWPASWIGSSLSLRDLAHHLANYLSGTLSNGSDVLIRYYDPRILPLFLVNFEKNVRETLMAPITYWAWWDRSFEMILKRGGNSREVQPTGELHISPVMQAEMAKAATIDLLQSNLVSDSEPDEFAFWPVHVLNSAVRRQVERARQLGFEHVADLQLFVSLALRIHPDFFSLISTFQRSMEHTRGEKTDLSSLVLSADDSEWNRLTEIGLAAITRLRKDIAHEIYDSGNH